MKHTDRRQIQTIFALSTKKPGHRTGLVWQAARKLSKYNLIPYFLRSNGFLLSGRFFIPMGLEHRAIMARTLAPVPFSAVPFRFTKKI
ncbi:hypothetical protein [Faecalibacterium prausnitzii]|uniref:hypothetical protein n=1 Tax=Faecalibacterium prausnitzii TaxID=853 RepID=UPI0022DF2879|nr:hypothetical protein [Faecalibacterium prausnitzii]